jgi:hypothetical protein
MIGSDTVPRTGQIVGVRQRLYLVEQIIHSIKPSDSTLVQLSCVYDDAQGQPLEVLWERELNARILSGEAWEFIAVRGFDPTQRFAAYLNTEHAPLELCHLHGPQTVAVSIQGWDSVGCLPVGTSAQGTTAAEGESLHCR